MFFYYKKLNYPKPLASDKPGSLSSENGLACGMRVHFQLEQLDLKEEHG